MSERTEIWQQMETAVDSICRKEAVLTENMRALADQADALVAEVSQLKGLFAQMPTEAITTVSVEPEVLPEDLPEPVTELASEAPVSETLPEVPGDVIQEETLQEEAIQRKTVPSETNWPYVAKTAADYEDIEVPPKEIGQFELNLGIKWLSRIGIVALLIGIALALSYSFPHFSNEMKILTGFMVAAALFFGGGKLYGHSAILGRILQGGGLSAGYLSLFAAFFIPDVQLFDAPGFGFSLLFLYVGLILGLSHRMNSQTVAMLSLTFGYYTGCNAMSQEVAFLSAGLLSLGTVILAKYHQDWKILPKANLLGAFSLYLAWYLSSWNWGSWRFTGGEAGVLSRQLYLAYTFLLFHCVSVLRGRQGDVVLNQLNTFGFYILFSCTLPQWAFAGGLEFMIAALQVGSLFYFKARHPEAGPVPLSTSLVLLTVLFVGLGSLKYFHSDTVSAVLAAEALCLGFLSQKGSYRNYLSGSAYAFFFVAFVSLLFEWSGMTDLTLMLSAAWVSLVGFLLEHFPFRKHNGIARGFLLVFNALLLFSAILSAIPGEWRTISFALTGFSFLACGFWCRRKLYRWAGLAWIFLVGGVSIIIDMIALDMIYKILLFILLGCGLLGGAYGYSRLERLISQEEKAKAEAQD